MRTDVCCDDPAPDEAPGGRPHAVLTSVPALLLALLPKCPLCLGAYLSAVGVGAAQVQAVARHPLMVPLLIALLLVHLRAVYRRSRQTRTVTALALSLSGTGALLAGAMVWDVRPLALAGAGLIALGALLAARARERGVPIPAA
jgi:protein SCO1/2